MTKRKREYVKYMKSEHWKLLREQVLQRDGRKCVECGYRLYLQCHHKKYANPLENTPIEWIVTLCRRCHENLHDNKKAERKAKRVRSKNRSRFDRLIYVIGAFSAAP